MIDATATLTRDLDYLRRLGACSEAVDYVESVGSIERAWRECDRADWLIWLAARVVDRRSLVGVASACARLALPIWTARYPTDSRVADCLDACDRYARGEDVDLVPYRRAAADAAAAYAAAYAAYAAAAAAYAAAAADADDAAAAAAYAAAYAYAYADAAADAAARRRVRAQCCEIVRERVTWPMVGAALEAKS